MTSVTLDSIMKNIELPDLELCRAKGLVLSPSPAPAAPAPVAPVVTTPPAVKLAQSDRLILLAEIENVAAEIAAVFGELPPGAQARCLELANHLAALRLKTLSRL